MTRQLAADVVVIGYGAAGAAAAAAAARTGAQVILAEKTARLGGTSLLSSGFVRVASDTAAAARYLTRTLGDRIEPSLVTAFARQLTSLPARLAELAAPLNAQVSVRFGADQPDYETSDLFTWPGRDSLGWAGITGIPGFHGYEWASPGNGHALMRVLSHHVDHSGVEVLFDTAACRLEMRDGQVAGVELRQGTETFLVSAPAVVLTTGGFEFDKAMLADNLQIPAIYPIGHPGNTGDGIRLSQQAGASMWHLWHVHASYGFRLPGHPVAIRNHLGGTRRSERPVAWILVDQHGRRFTNEAPPAPQDTPWRAMQQLDAESGAFDRIPCWLIFDENGRRLGPLGKPAWSTESHRYKWSADNSQELSQGWILQGSDLAELAKQTAIDPGQLTATVAAWNGHVAKQADPYGRPPGTMLPLQCPPFYAIETWPVLSNTHGGPRHDARQRVLDESGHPISGLFAAGELGSLFGHIYLLGGNLAEAIVGGEIAGTEAACASA
jgi:succinate dehydrogenase/fumarate reductase flavoprotein subunit